MFEEKQRLISEWVENDKNTVLHLLEKAEFRAFLCRLIAASGVFDAPVTESDREHWKAEGKRLFGLEIINDIEAAKHGAGAEIIKQMFEDRRIKTEQIRKVEENYGGTD